MSVLTNDNEAVCWENIKLKDKQIPGHSKLCV